MDKVFFSFITGLFYTGGLFFICLFAVVGAKVLIKNVFNKPNVAKAKKLEKPPEKKSKSIEINADEVERIYFKKSS